jgi:Ca2+-binding EF-hand superfamily protein
MRVSLIIILSIVSITFQGTALSIGEDLSGQEKEFCRLDKNNDREITLEEFKACEFYKLEHVKALPYVDAMDLTTDKQGVLSEDELKTYLFRRADKNRDNKIDRKEWEEFYNSLIEPGGGISRGHFDRR